jgi:hypothetical protein
MHGRLGVVNIVLLSVLGTPMPVSAQETKTSEPLAAESAAAASDARKPAATQRYRFQERYFAPRAGSSVVPEPVPGFIQGPYLVGFRETKSEMRERPEGAPARIEITRQARYLERVLLLNFSDVRRVVAVQRRYEAGKIAPEPAPIPGIPPFFEGLNLLIRYKRNADPEILNLTPGRPLYGREFTFAADQVLVPDLAFALPLTPVRVGQSFAVDEQAMPVLFQGPVRQADVRGTLLEVAPDPANPDELLATFEIKGTALTLTGESRLRARLIFRFPAASLKAAGEADAPEIAPLAGIDAEKSKSAAPSYANCLGWMTRVSLGQMTTVPAGSEGAREIRRELILERRAAPDDTVLEPPPSDITPNEQNSWITFLDPDGQFSIKYPQNFQIDFSERPAAIALRRNVAPAPDILRLEFHPGEALKPEEVFETYFKGLESQQVKLVRTPTTVLPAADFPDRKVVRSGATFKVMDSETSQNAWTSTDAYVIQFARNATLVAQTMTAADPPDPVRSMMETMLRSFTLLPGSSEGAAGPRE